MTRTRITLTATTLGLTALLGLSACGVAASPAAAPAPAAAAAGLDASTDASLDAFLDVALTGEAAALQAPDPSASAAPGGRDGRRGMPGAGKFLRSNTLHGEMTVQGKDGVRTVVVQRGTVTATDGKTVTVKSIDGFTLAWRLGDPLRVVQDKKQADVSAIKTGATVGVAGLKSGATTTARLVRLG